MSREGNKPMSANTHKAPEAALPSDTRLALYRLLVELRYTEKRAYDLFLQNLIKGTSHLALGQEAVAAGFGYAMQKDDYTFCTYRGHHHTLARGASMTGVLGELMGRECGLLAGKGGSMHLTSVEHGVMGSYAIVGSHLPIAVGAAWSAQYRGTRQAAVAFFGDGTTNIGAFHEAVNLAAVWKLPVVFVCENNLYMEYTPIGAVTAVPHPAADRAAAYGLDSIIVDGNDVDAVYAVAMRTLARARAGEGPSLVEAKTYRHSGHSRADPGKYRPTREVEAWMKRDPLPTYRQRLLGLAIPEAELAASEPPALDKAMLLQMVHIPRHAARELGVFGAGLQQRLPVARRWVFSGGVDVSRRVMPVQDRIVEAEFETLLLRFIRKGPDWIFAVRCGIDYVVLADAAVEHREPVVMLRSDNDVLHAGVFGDSDPLSSVKLDRVELRSEFLVFGPRDASPIHDPLADFFRSLSVVLSSGDGIESPVYEHSEPRFSPPLHSLVALGRCFIVGCRMPGICSGGTL